MKYSIQLFACLGAAATMSILSGCGKSGTSPSKQNSTTTIMRPVSSTFVQTGGTPITAQYTYDSDNNLTGYGSEGNYEIAVNAHTVTQSFFTSEFDDVDTYSYTGASNTPVDIYTDIPTEMSISMYTKDNNAGTSITIPGKLWAFQGSNTLITKMFTSDQGGENIDFTYDANSNFKTISFTNLSGMQAGKVVVSMIVEGVDNHPLPFSSVKGYNVISIRNSSFLIMPRHFARIIQHKLFTNDLMMIKEIWKSLNRMISRTLIMPKDTPLQLR